MRSRWMGWKMPLCKWHIFWMAQWFYCHIVSYWEEMTSYGNYSQYLTLKFKWSGKCQLFSAVDGGIEMPKNSWISKKIQLKWKVLKHSTRPNQ